MIESLDLHDVVVVGHSTGGGEVVRYAAAGGAGGEGRDRRRRAADHGEVRQQPGGHADRGVRRHPRRSAQGHVAVFGRIFPAPFFGANREGSQVSQGARDDFWRQGMLVNMAAAYDCLKAFSETDQTADLQAIDVPMFIAHGGDDQIVPIAAAAEKSIKLVKTGTLEGVPRSAPRDLRCLPRRPGQGHPRLHRQLVLALRPPAPPTADARRQTPDGRRPTPDGQTADGTRQSKMPVFPGSDLTGGGGQSSSRGLLNWWPARSRCVGCARWLARASSCAPSGPSKSLGPTPGTP